MRAHGGRRRRNAPRKVGHVVDLARNRNPEVVAVLVLGQLAPRHRAARALDERLARLGIALDHAHLSTTINVCSRRLRCDELDKHGAGTAAPKICCTPHKFERERHMKQKQEREKKNATEKRDFLWFFFF